MHSAVKNLQKDLKVEPSLRMDGVIGKKSASAFIFKVKQMEKEKEEMQANKAINQLSEDSKYICRSVVDK